VNPGKDGDITTLLLEPRENLAIGMAYLAHLLRRFEGDLLLALCGYNAGPGRAERWKEELPQDRDAFLESIPFTETRNYVKKVLTNYFAYSVLYRGVSPFPGTS
jgi:soluble lytic murein transglycosylase